MRIITLNVNGIRAAARKGFFGWLGKQSADVVCIQPKNPFLAAARMPLAFSVIIRIVYFPLADGR